jgi:predicted phosphodiesterase
VRRHLTFGLVAALGAEVLAPPLSLPNAEGSLKFAVLGDFGEASKRQYALAGEMVRFRGRYPFEMVVLAGDNIYGSQGPQDLERKFEDPYGPLLGAGVKFFAVLGNHDGRAQCYYEPFNMGGRPYYTFKAPRESVRFFMLDSTEPTPAQIAWLEKELKASQDDWKLVVLHHPLYSSGRRHGSNLKLRETLEPLLVELGVSVVFAGHDHIYERVKPQRGIVHFVVGSGGRLRRGDLDPRSALTAKGADHENVFLAVEIHGDELHYAAVATGGAIVDSGRIERRHVPTNTVFALTNSRMP